MSILKNETYTGIAYMNKTRSVEPQKHPKINKYRKRRKSSKVERPREEWIGVPVPQIIEREQWEAAQRLLKKNARTSPRNNKENQYMLRGLVICGLCGSMAPGNVSNKKAYYSCGAKRNKNFTTKPHDDQRVIAEHKNLDNAVWQGLTELLYDPEQLQAQVESRLERKQSYADLPNAKLEKLEREFDKLAAQEARILDAYREEVISLDELRNQKEKIANQRKVLEARQKMLQSQQENTGQPEINLAMLGDLSERYQRVMEKADFQTREKIANLLINRVALYPDKARVEGNIPFHPDALVPSNHASPLQRQRDLGFPVAGHFGDLVNAGVKFFAEAGDVSVEEAADDHGNGLRVLQCRGIGGIRPVQGRSCRCWLRGSSWLRDAGSGCRGWIR